MHGLQISQKNTTKSTFFDKLCLKQTEYANLSILVEVEKMVQ